MTEQVTRRQLLAEIVLFDGPSPDRIRFGTRGDNPADPALWLRFESFAALQAWVPFLAEVTLSAKVVERGPGDSMEFAYAEGRRSGWNVQMTAEWTAEVAVDQLDDATRGQLRQLVDDTEVTS
jgi:hypothetical protein